MLKKREDAKIAKHVMTHVYNPQINWGDLSKAFKSHELRIGVRAMLNDPKADSGKKVSEIALMLKHKVKADMSKIYTALKH